MSLTQKGAVFHGLMSTSLARQTHEVYSYFMAKNEMKKKNEIDVYHLMDIFVIIFNVAW